MRHQSRWRRRNQQQRHPEQRHDDRSPGTLPIDLHLVALLSTQLPAGDEKICSFQQRVHRECRH